MTSPSETLIIASDHAGFKLKEFIKGRLDELGIPYSDAGTYSEDSTDYPVWIGKAARSVSRGEFRRGIAICGSGIGASIVANRFSRVRAALCFTAEMARMSRRHNNANMLVMGERIVSSSTASEILDAWLNTDFDGGRHEKRVNQIDDLRAAESA